MQRTLNSANADRSGTQPQGTTDEGWAAYQLLVVGGGPDVHVDREDVKVIDVRDAEGAVEVANRFAAAGLRAGDLRARALFVAGDDPADTASALVAYAVLLGFAGRWVDFSATPEADEVVDARASHEAVARSANRLMRPDERIKGFQLGRPHPDLPSAGFPASRSEHAAVMPAVRFAQRLRMVADVPPLGGLSRLVWAAAVRSRRHQERLPSLVVGTEPSDDQQAGVCLHAARQAGLELRQRHRGPDVPIIAAADVDARLQRLQHAAEQDLPTLLQRLGSVGGDDGLWRCTRPARHSNGDARPSTVLNEHGVRCMRCDAEPIDALRLTAETLNVSPDEAADFILGEATAEQLLDLDRG